MRRGPELELHSEPPARPRTPPAALTPSPCLGVPQPLTDWPWHPRSGTPPDRGAGLGTAGGLHAHPESPQQVFIDHLLGVSLAVLGAGGERTAFNLKLTWRARGSWGVRGLQAAHPWGASLPGRCYPFPGRTAPSSNPRKAEAQGQLPPGAQHATVPSAVTATGTPPGAPAPRPGAGVCGMVGLGAWLRRQGPSPRPAGGGGRFASTLTDQGETGVRGQPRGTPRADQQPPGPPRPSLRPDTRSTRAGAVSSAPRAPARLARKRAPLAC